MLRILENELNDDLIRLCAYDLLARLEIRTFPVDVLRFFEVDPTIHYCSVKNLALHAGVSLSDLISADSAGLIYRARDGQDYVYMNTDYPYLQRVWNLALAIASLELDAVPRNAFVDIPKDRYSVIEFAYYFLAPDIILESCKFFSQDKIFRFCRIPFRASLKKAIRMKFRFKHKKATAVDKVLLSNFQGYIDKIKLIT